MYSVWLATFFWPSFSFGFFYSVYNESAMYCADYRPIDGLRRGEALAAFFGFANLILFFSMFYEIEERVCIFFFIY